MNPINILQATCQFTIHMKMLMYNFTYSLYVSGCKIKMHIYLLEHIFYIMYVARAQNYI